jgi:hypothetical protein
MVKIHTVTLDGRVYSLGFKVVTEDLESLGLRRNPHILQYPVCEWYFLPQDNIRKGPDDFGGIWVARTLSGARGLRRYMQKQYSQNTRIFRAALDEILYANDYRVKTNGINMFEEVFD